MLHTKVIDTKEKKLSILEAENFISSSEFGASIFFFWNCQKSKR